MKITFLGGGNMANALIGGLVNKGFAGSDIRVIDLNKENRERLSKTYGLTAFANVEAAAVSGSDVVVLAVKPQQMKEAVAPLAGLLQASQLLLTIAAGLPLAALSRWLKGHSNLVRAMPNTPALIGAGITGLYALPRVSDSDRENAARIVQAVGETVWIQDEAQMDSICALSGSGPAYVFLFIEALQEAGAAMGFNEEQSRRLAIETVLGSAKLAAQSDESAAVLRERVTSKGGTTAAALTVMAERGTKEGIIAGVRAAEDRGRELGQQLGAA